MNDIQKIRELKEVRDRAWAVVEETEAAAQAEEEVRQREREEINRRMVAAAKACRAAWAEYTKANDDLEKAKKEYWDDL